MTSSALLQRIRATHHRIDRASRTVLDELATVREPSARGVKLYAHIHDIKIDTTIAAQNNARGNRNSKREILSHLFITGRRGQCDKAPTPCRSIDENPQTLASTLLNTYLDCVAASARPWTRPRFSQWALPGTAEPSCALFLFQCFRSYQAESPRQLWRPC